MTVQGLIRLFCKKIAGNVCWVKVPWKMNVARKNSKILVRNFDLSIFLFFCHPSNASSFHLVPVSFIWSCFVVLSLNNEGGLPTLASKFKSHRPKTWLKCNKQCDWKYLFTLEYMEKSNVSVGSWWKRLSLCLVGPFWKTLSRYLINLLDLKYIYKQEKIVKILGQPWKGGKWRDGTAKAPRTHVSTSPDLEAKGWRSSRFGVRRANHGSGRSDQPSCNSLIETETGETQREREICKSHVKTVCSCGSR